MYKLVSANEREIIMVLSKEMVAASATPLILSILASGDSYGYEIIRQVRRYSSGEMEWADGMLYPILHRLETKSLISSYAELAENGRKRKYYKISKAGLRVLVEQRNNWERVNNMLLAIQS